MNHNPHSSDEVNMEGHQVYKISNQTQPNQKKIILLLLYFASCVFLVLFLCNLFRAVFKELVNILE
jgi:hypothetical protein